MHPPEDFPGPAPAGGIDSCTDHGVAPIDDAEAGGALRKTAGPGNLALPAGILDPRRGECGCPLGVDPVPALFPKKPEPPLDPPGAFPVAGGAHGDPAAGKTVAGLFVVRIFELEIRRISGRRGQYRGFGPDRGDQRQYDRGQECELFHTVGQEKGALANPRRVYMKTRARKLKFARLPAGGSAPAGSSHPSSGRRPSRTRCPVSPAARKTPPYESGRF